MSDNYEDIVDDIGGPTAEAAPIHADGGSQEERARAREQLNADVEAFLASGGNIKKIDVNVMADPPKRPQSNYGGQPI